MKPEATAIGDPQDGRWKITLMFCIPKFRHSMLQQTTSMTSLVIADQESYIFYAEGSLADAGTGPVPAMKSEATAIFAPQDGRWKITVAFDGRRFCVPKFRH